MDKDKKPFACEITGCEMTFTNEDHLNCHQKKHDMVLNLGLASKNSDLDETPTPTRFIRNCEEVGLFQDLQNVNPFDETFKKAIESAKDGNQLNILQPNLTSDDTLHTPHIFPLAAAAAAGSSSSTSEFCLNSVNSVTISSGEDDNTCDSFPLKIVTETKHVKDKLKQAIQNKNNNKTNNAGMVITPVPLEKLQENPEINNKRTNSNDETNISKKQKIIVDDDKEKIREMNRAAQLRCRKRKQVQWKKMEEELKHLKNENIRLSKENNCFKQNFYALKELLLNHKRNPSTAKNSLFLKKIEEIINSSAHETISNNKIAISRQKPKLPEKKLSPILPIAQKPPVLAQKPLLIQVMGPVSTLAFSVLPNK